MLNMTKKITLILLSLCWTVTLQAKTYYGPTSLSDQKEDSISIFGPAQLDKVSVDNMTVTGMLSFKKLKVTSTMEVKGPVKGEEGIFGDFNAIGPTQLAHCKINSLNVAGPLSTSFVTVSNRSTVIGPFEASDSQFADITVTSDIISFTNTHLKNIHIKKNESNKSAQVLELKGATIVTADITFESGKGKVYIEKTTKVEGKISGGTVSSTKE